MNVYVQGPEITGKKKEKEAVELKQRQRERDEHQGSIVSSLVSNGTYTLLGRQLDYLSKELVRLQVMISYRISLCIHWLYISRKSVAYTPSCYWQKGSAA